MIRHLQKRLGGCGHIRFHQTDGMSLPALPKGTLDYVVAFDVFVHFEPRLVYWYLRQIRDLLKPGGIGVIHYANALTPIGWRQFMADLDENVKRRIHFAAFGVMCPQLMEQFLRVLGLEIVSIDTQIIPRDAVAVFRAPGV